MATIASDRARGRPPLWPPIRAHMPSSRHAHSPVVDRLVTDAKLPGDDLRFNLATEQQQARCPRTRVPVPMIDRQLLQRYLLGFAQFNDTPRPLHPLPRHHEAARLAKLKSFYQGHLVR
jgi:hypothetical protein